MKNREIRPKRLTGNTSQYVYFRQENSRLFEYLRLFPVLPRSAAVRFHRTWEFPDFLLSRITYNIEPHARAAAYLSIPKTTPPHGVPGIVALHPEYFGRGAGKSLTIGFVEELGTGAVAPVQPPERPPLSQHMKAFAYAWELCERGFAVLSPDIPGFEEYARDGRRERDWEGPAQARYLLHGSALAAKTLHDLYGAISALTGMDGVDGSSIGVFGYGLGGECAVMLAAFDRRVQAAVAASGAFSYDTLENGEEPIRPHRVIPGIRTDGTDFDFFLDLVSPTPLLVMHVPAPEERRVVLRRRENQQTISIEKPGSFPPSVRNRSYGFLEKELFSYRKNLFSDELG